MLSQWSRRPVLDWATAGAAVVAWVAARTLADWRSPLDAVDADSRRAIYGALGAAGATAVGLFIIPVSIALGLASRERLARMLSQKQGQLRRSVMHAGAAAVFAIVYSLVAIALDTTTGAPPPVGNPVSFSAPWLRPIAPAVLVLLVLSIVRVLSVLGALLHLSELEAAPSSADRIREEGRALRIAGRK